MRFSKTETQKKRLLLRRMGILHGVLLVGALFIIARLVELQLIKVESYHNAARSQHYGGVVLPARRGEILGMSSKTGETSVMATNTTLDMVYVDPLIVDDPSEIARLLADVLITDAFYDYCKNGDRRCPRELVKFFKAAFDPLFRARELQSGALLEPLSSSALATRTLQEDIVPTITEVRRQFMLDIEKRISTDHVNFVPIKYSATKMEMNAVEELNIPGISVSFNQYLIFADPESVSQSRLANISRVLADVLDLDPSLLEYTLRSRPLRYVPIMRRLPPALSLKIKELKVQSYKDTQARKAAAPTRQEADRIQEPLRNIALLGEHWRYYPDGVIASQVVGFLNTNQEPQYGIERTFHMQLYGQEGYIRTVNDLKGGRVFTSEQKIVDPEDGDTIVLTIDPAVQREVEHIVAEGRELYKANSIQAIVMDPATGRIIALVNTPLFNRNSYGDVFEKEPVLLSSQDERNIVVEVFHYETNTRVVKAYFLDIFSQDGREILTEKTRQTLDALEESFDLADLTRYYVYTGENNRFEIFPTDISGVWLKYKNSIGVGAYLNRVVQEIYEPGSVLKPITMAIAIDQGEVTPSDIYHDDGPVEVDEYTIKNALRTYYGDVTMTRCLELSINTCMTSVSEKLGPKLFHHMLDRFGFGKITGIALEDELPGEILPWRKWSRALLATASFGQGISVTPLQMTTAFSVLANEGKLMQPYIIDHIRHANGEREMTEPQILDQVITPEASDTITAMLVSAVENGFAKSGKVPGYHIAGKTGTSQIAGPGGKYESGTGSTVASFIGYAPVNRPRFVVLVKVDRPKFAEEVHGAAAAAPIFRDIAGFLLKYYGVQPDDAG
ncbi:hypothetical protein A3D11_04370 [Candidatus Peribacteria bacterium RIFCSPHIGHO2_02_FULL_49_16]|nr:MAG: hypothetical protein A2880_03935 [Candidatus Peribacteria bacterium RIFCSPHIGHO2_01_FULL_49_38]OGJ58938.1 MAG: hypothetical protein A3D11_04370 [Candidatus Peribacteria bacterium RIFCSPHIGHO2_02_FULL_49_16]